MIIIVTEDPLIEPATPEYCDYIREQIGDVQSTVVLYDPEAEFSIYGKNDTVVITNENTRIVYKKKGASPETIEAEIEKELNQ